MRNGIISFHVAIKVVDKDDFHQIKRIVMLISTVFFLFGKMTSQKTPKTSKPQKSESLPVNALWNLYLRLISFSKSRNRLMRKAGCSNRLYWRFIKGR